MTVISYLPHCIVERRRKVAPCKRPARPCTRLGGKLSITK